MSFNDNAHITTQDLLFQGILHDIKKSKLALQPIFEAFTNALEAIKIKSIDQNNFIGNILIKIFAVEATDKSTEFKSLVIKDNGIGFNDIEYKRFNTFKDFTKGFKNLGSGRIQYAHFFDSTIINSIFHADDKCKEREFIISKQESFLKKNAIVYNKFCKEIDLAESGTTVTFNNLLENSNVYNNLDAQSLKEALLERYIHYFCYNKTNLPEIKIEFYVQSELKDQTTISQSDIPPIDKTEPIDLPYSKISGDGKTIEKLTKTEKFQIDSFKIKKDILKANDLKLVSKGEVVEESNIGLQSLAEGDHIKDFKFLFLVSSPYIDSRDTNVRGILNIPDRESFSKQGNFFTSEEILLEDIQEEINRKINVMYPEIEEVKQKHNEQLQKLKEMFLLDDETAKGINISINDSESKILEKFYEAEAKKVASIDACIKESVDNLNNLDTNKATYQDDLKKAVDELVKTIPLQNKKALTHYVARRKLVLELFQKILNNETSKLQNGGRIDEDVLHNLIFQQSSKDPMNSDLWLVNEEYIYFKGVSEGILGQIELDGSKIIKEVLSPEEQEYRTKQGGDARLKRTDILLFPAEGKCIIIEMKAPEQNISAHLNQINRYASLINNLSIDTLKFNTFYGYLIGESIDADDVIDNDSDFINAPNLGYIFRPYKRIVGKFGRPDGSLYTEITKYSTLLERAKLRNKIFIDKLNIKQ